MPITLSLSGKVALITGGSRGIGAAAVRMFVAAGALVMFNYEKSKTQSERLVKEMGKKNCAGIHCNLSRTGDRKSTRLNSRHSQISDAVFCLKKKNPMRTCNAD